jgi:hypothetical protein
MHVTGVLCQHCTYVRVRCISLSANITPRVSIRWFPEKENEVHQTQAHARSAKQLANSGY